MTCETVMHEINQIIKGKNGAPDITAAELALKWELGAIRKSDLTTHYNVTEKQIFEFAKAFKKRTVLKCQNCDEEIDDGAFQKGVCGKCGEEFRYGRDGCSG